MVRPVFTGRESGAGAEGGAAPDGRVHYGGGAPSGRSGNAARLPLHGGHRAVTFLPSAPHGSVAVALGASVSLGRAASDRRSFSLGPLRSPPRGSTSLRRLLEKSLPFVFIIIVSQ
ncbi:Hypothetical protein NTJ_05461 [Nesidiocoris tenuis]|uniref:Uncharacterized protein n=1 Tax=Nesidiocoris tenuis TaxID=355587 RepID=A0ABN7AK70_9HEMI|nr:Hypothetical protein NTJ_05461 [Nesidiocoris tenuis]